MLERRPGTLLSGPPPPSPPPSLVNCYTRCGAIPMADMYVDDSEQGTGTHYTFDHAMIEGMRERAASGHIRDRHDVYFLAALEAYPVDGLHVAVFGSMEPWHEAVLLARGAARVTTVDYNELTYTHPQLDTMRVQDLRDAMAAVTTGGSAAHLPQFDAIVSMSSVDHDGLGRYGDPLDPDADLRAMDEFRRILRPGGRLYVSVPVGPDVVVWNLHRRYGRVRLPLMLQGWHALECKRCGWDEDKLDAKASWTRSFEPVWVLQGDKEKEKEKEEL